MYWTADRFILIAGAVTLIALDGLRRAIKRRREEEISQRQFIAYLSVLALGCGLTWFAYFQRVLSD